MCNLQRAKSRVIDPWPRGPSSVGGEVPASSAMRPRPWRWSREAAPGFLSGSGDLGGEPRTEGVPAKRQRIEMPKNNVGGFVNNGSVSNLPSRHLQLWCTRRCGTSARSQVMRNGSREEPNFLETTAEQGSWKGEKKRHNVNEKHYSVHHPTPLYPTESVLDCERIGNGLL